MKIALLFPGQGAQKVGMGKDLFENFPAARQVYEEASDALSMNVAKLCFDGPESDLTRTENTQPTVLVTSIAAFRVLAGETQLKPSISAGHSLGEYTAICAAGGLELKDAARIVRLRGRFMQDAVPEGEGAMAAIIGMDAEKIEKLCRDVAEETGQVVVPSNYNSLEQVAISGHAKAVERASALAIERGAKKAIPLKVSAPFHSPLMKPAAEKLSEELIKLAFHDTAYPVFANVDAEPHQKAEEFVALLTRQVTEPVLWTQIVKRFKDHEIELAIEIGPGRVLTGLVKNTDRNIKTANVEDIQTLKKTLPLIK
jgi:[acyl-carrier-protein] S-malonyltransferase